MSAFLGPIHYWLYNKIQLQEDMIREIVSCGEREGWPELSKELINQSVSEDRRPLEALIDTGNIHGWLQARIHDAEGRYASLVTTLLKAEPSRMEALKAAMFQLGESRKIESTADARDAFQAFEDSLLNGMPCDRVNVLTEQDAEQCSWQETQDIHAEYWEKAEGKVENYYILRRAFMQGMLSGSSLSLSTDGDHQYRISSKGAEV